MTEKLIKSQRIVLVANVVVKTTGETGTQATAGRTVAAPSKFAFGTKLNIGGHIYTVEDRGGAIKGNRIDIYVSSHSAALQWGVKYLPVSVAQ